MSNHVCPGRVVRYVARSDSGQLVDRPAVVVRVWTKDLPPLGNGCANLQVFLDGSNDRDLVGVTAEECARGIAWRMSAAYSDAHEPGTWHWPPRED